MSRAPLASMGGVAVVCAPLASTERATMSRASRASRVCRVSRVSRVTHAILAGSVGRVSPVGNVSQLIRVCVLLFTVVATLSLAATPAQAEHPGAAQDSGRLRAVRPAAWKAFTLEGYFRTRAAVLHNLDLDRGGTPTTGAPIFPVPLAGGQVLGSADARLRLDLGVNVGDVVKAKVRVDALDGLVLGSTPGGFPPTRWSQAPWASTTQVPPRAGANAFLDSIRVKEVWGEVLLPIGVVRFGRMALPRWGLGLVSGGPEDLDDDYDDLVDRIGFATSLADHLVGVSFDINAIGPTSANSAGGMTNSRQAIDLELQDNVYTLSVAFARLHDEPALRRRRAASKPTFSYGVYATWRWQVADFPGFYAAGIAGEDLTLDAADAVPRRMNAVLADGWLRVHTGPVRLEVEAAYGWAKIEDPTGLVTVSLPEITANQFGGVFEAEVEALNERVFVELGVGLASGDSAPGLGIAPPVGQATSAPGDFDGPQFDLRGDTTVDNFRFHPNYRIDLVFWRRIAGSVTDAVYFRPQLTLVAGPAFRARLWGVVSVAVQPESTPGGDPFYGGEIDLEAEWSPVAGFVARGQYGLFLPGAALRNRDRSLTAQPAQVARLILAVTW